MKILMPIDLEDESSAAKSLRAMAKYVNEDDEVWLINVMAGYEMPMVASYFPKGAIDSAVESVTAKLEELGNANVGQDRCNVKVSLARPAKAILDASKELNCDLIVICARKHSTVEKMMLGSVTAKVVDRASCDVLVIRP